MRIAQYFTPVLYFEGESLGTGDGFSDLHDLKNPTASSVGLGLIVGTPPGKIGGFGEFDLVFSNAFDITATQPGLGDCDITARGGAIRFGGGGVFPVLDWFNVTPFATATIGRFTTLKTSGTGCSLLNQTIPVGDIPSDDTRTHGMVLLGVGGDVVFGKDRANP